MSEGRFDIDLHPLRQPDEVSCGPTCLTVVLWHLGDTHSFEEVDARVDRNREGGTIAVFLGRAALDLGYRATLTSYNVRIFDPTWRDLSSDELIDRLVRRRATLDDEKLAVAHDAYVSFLREGGSVSFEELRPRLLFDWLRQGVPVLCGLSSTYLYRAPRENPWTQEADPIGGQPAGHFVVVCGADRARKTFTVYDPYPGHPMGEQARYEVAARRLLNAILLGDVTHDAVLLTVEPQEVR